MVYSPDDTVVVSSRAMEAAALWGTGIETWAIAGGEGVDPASHVIVGDILSPAMTDEAVERFTAWIAGL